MSAPALSDAPADRTLLGFMALSVLVGTANGISRVTLPLFGAHLHAAPWQIGLVGGLQFAGMLLLSMPLGGLIDRHGSRPLFRIGAASAALLYGVGLSQVSTPWQLILCVALLGISIPFRLVPTQTEFLHLLPTLSPAKAGWNRGSHTLGMFFAGPMLGALAIGALGFSITFMLVGLGVLATLVIGNRVLGVAPPGRGDEAPALGARIRSQLELIAERPMLRRTMGIDFCGQMAMAYFSVFIVLTGIREFGMSTPAAAGLVTLQGALFVATLFVGGSLMARVGEERRYLAAFTLLLAHAVLLGFASAPPMLWAAALCLGFGLGIQHLTSVTRFGALMRELGRGRIGGMSSLAGPAGGLTGATLGGLIGQRFGVFGGWRVIAAIYLLQWLLQWRRLRLDRPAP